MVFVLIDDYGNEIGVSSKELGDRIIGSGTNPFKWMFPIVEYDDIIVDSYEEFCNVFY